MSSNQNKTTNICGKVICDDNLKRHMNSKHNKLSSTMWYREKGQQCRNLLDDSKHNNESIAEGCKVEVLNDSEVSYTANLKLEVQLHDEVYQKNVDIGEQISILLESENIREKSLSKQNKFCLDLFDHRNQ